MQTVLVLKDIIRRYPDVTAPYAATLQALPVSDLQTDEAAAAFFWIRAEMVVQGVPEADGVEPVRARTALLDCSAGRMRMRVRDLVLTWPHCIAADASAGASPGPADMKPSCS